MVQKRPAWFRSKNCNGMWDLKMDDEPYLTRGWWALVLWLDLDICTAGGGDGMGQMSHMSEG